MSKEGSQRICIQQDNGVSNKITAFSSSTTDIVGMFHAGLFQNETAEGTLRLRRLSLGGRNREPTVCRRR
jgi:hypothetical protein